LSVQRVAAKYLTSIITPLPFAGTGEYIAASASFEQFGQLPAKSQPAERNDHRVK